MATEEYKKSQSEEEDHYNANNKDRVNVTQRLIELREANVHAIRHDDIEVVEESSGVGEELAGQVLHFFGGRVHDGVGVLGEEYVGLVEIMD